MLTTHNMPRGSGKTTKVIEMMKEDKNLYCIVPFKEYARLYPNDLQSRIIRGNQDINFELSSRRISKIVLDEGFAYNKVDIANIYYTLGQRGISVVAFGTN